MSGSVWDKKTLCIVTGASQGIGRTISIEFAKRLGEGSTLVLLARSLDNLEKTRQLVLECSKVDVLVESSDLSKPDIEKYSLLMKRWTEKSYDCYMLVHNAGSEGNGSMAASMTDLQEWQSYMSLNLFSVTLLTSCFLTSLKSVTSLKLIVNITSLCGIEPFSGLGYYCVSKASREMYFRVLAKENPSLRVLNYSPGPVDTGMIDRVIGSLQVDQTKQMFSSMKSQSTLLAPSQTVAKLVSYLEANHFTSGQRIDYFDL